MAESMESPQITSSEEIVELLSAIEQRSRKYAVGLPQKDQLQSFWEGVMFYVGEARMVAPLSEISEILNYPTVMTRVPGIRPWLLGVANIRGTLIPVIDLQLFLVGRKTQRSRRSRVLVFQIESGLTGVLVGEMVGMRHFDKDTVIGKERVSGHFDRYIQYGFDQDGVTWPVISLSALGEDQNFQMAAS